jgi:hypothetical protein
VLIKRPTVVWDRVATNTTSNPTRPFRRVMAGALLLVLIWDTVINMKGGNPTLDVAEGATWLYFEFGHEYLPDARMHTVSPLELIRKLSIGAKRGCG